MSRRRHHRETNGGVDSMLAAGAHVALSGFVAELRAAGDALDTAAHVLRTVGLGAEASQAMQAALRARDAAGVEGA